MGNWPGDIPSATATYHRGIWGGAVLPKDEDHDLMIGVHTFAALSWFQCSSYYP